MKNNLVLALDIGFAHTGMVLADIDPGVPAGYAVLKVGCVHSDEVKKRYGKVHARDIYRTDLDIERAGYTFKAIREFAGSFGKIAMVVAESPNSGGKSAVAIRSMGIATGVLGAFIADNPQARFVNVQPLAVKKAVGGSATAGKEGVAAAVKATFGAFPWPPRKKDAEHILDAAGALLAARDTDVYKMFASFGGRRKRHAG